MLQSLICPFFIFMLLLDLWKPVVGLEETMQVNFIGTVRRAADYYVKVAHIDNYGYKRINFELNGIRLKKRVHRIVAEAFIENRDCKPEVNHIDGNKLNNNGSNLEWSTKVENLKHARDFGLYESLKRVPDAVVEYIRINTYSIGIDEMAVDLGLSKMTVYMYATGRFRKSEALLKPLSVKLDRRVVLDVNTGVFYEKVSELCQLIGVKSKYLYRKLNGELTNNTPYIYV